MRRWRWTALLAGAVLACLQARLAAAGLSPEEKRGKQIYLRGVSPSGKSITASLGDATALPGDSLTCAGCHGLDGMGKPEGGVVPSNITWDSLTKPYGHQHPAGRQHPAYTEQSIKRAIAMGVDPSGNKFGVIMPKFTMSAEDMSGLLAYLKRLGKDTDPGLTGTSIRIGTILPGEGPLAEAGRDLKELLTAYFDDFNAHAGVYNRRVELRVMEAPAGLTKTRIESFLAQEDIFALVGPLAPGADQEIASIAESQEVPLVGPLTMLPDADPGAHRHIFYLLSSLTDQARVLVDFAAAKLDLKNPRVAMIFPHSPLLLGVVQAMEQQCKKAGCSAAIRIDYPTGGFTAASVAQDLRRNGTQVVCFLGSASEFKDLMKEAEASDLRATFLLSGSLAGRDVFDVAGGTRNKIFIAYPTLPSDQTPAGLEQFRALVLAHGLLARHLPFQISAYSAAGVLVEGLRRCGRELSREKLLTELEGFYEFETGLTPAITYGPNRRVGALGAYIVTVDRERRRFVPVGAWITPE